MEPAIRIIWDAVMTPKSMETLRVVIVQQSRREEGKLGGQPCYVIMDSTEAKGNRIAFENGQLSI